MIQVLLTKPCLKKMLRVGRPMICALMLCMSVLDNRLSLIHIAFGSPTLLGCVTEGIILEKHQKNHQSAELTNIIDHTLSVL